MFVKVKDYENYTINEEGIVMNKKGKELKPCIHTTGYKMVDLYKDGKRKHFRLHRLLAETFIPNPNNYKIIDHIDRDRLNNNLNNLRWTTPTGNALNREFKGGGISYEEMIRGEKVYEYYRLRWQIHNVRYSKRFKNLEEAEKFKQKLIQENSNVNNIDEATKC